MKKLSTLLFLLIGLVSFSQSNLTIFNNGGQQFYVILNGIKQNSVPMTNVSVAGIKNGSYSVKMIFSDGKTADIDKNFFIEEPSDITTRIIFKKGKGKLQLIGMVPTTGANTTQGVIVYRPDNAAVYSDAVVTTQTVTTQQTNTNTATTNGTNGNMTINQSGNVPSGTTQSGSVNMSGTTNTNTNTNGQTVNQTISVTDPNNPNGNVGMNVSINVSDPQMGGENVNMSVNMNGMGTGTQTTTNTTNTNNQSNQGNTQYSQNTTVTTTTTTSGTQTNNNTINTNNNTNVTTSTNTAHPVVACKNIVNDENKFIAEMNSIMMDDDKRDFVLSQMTNFCLTASQAYKITEVLKFEDDRLIVAKFLYDRMIDKDNSNSLLPLFKFDDSKMEYAAYSRK